MTQAAQNKQQQHPQWQSDRQIVDSLLSGSPTDYNLIELGRLRIRYRGFPGATDIQTDLEKVLQQWGFTEAELYQKTQKIHVNGQIYKIRSNKGDTEDWS